MCWYLVTFHGWIDPHLVQCQLRESLLVFVLLSPTHDLPAWRNTYTHTHTPHTHTHTHTPTPPPPPHTHTDHGRRYHLFNVFCIAQSRIRILATPDATCTTCCMDNGRNNTNVEDSQYQHNMHAQRKTNFMGNRCTSTHTHAQWKLNTHVEDSQYQRTCTLYTHSEQKKKKWEVK